MSKPTQEQQQIIHALGTNVAVSAGAGSGKTQVLIGRFMHILETSLAQGADANGKYQLNVDQIVAITFTKKAAAEMRSRLRRELNAKLDSISEAVAAGTLDGLLAKQYTKFWQEQLERLPRTHISTIHSLCSYILRENPLEANLDPQFTVAEEFQGTDFVQKCLECYLRQALKNQQEHVVALVTSYGLTSFLAQVNLLLPELDALENAGDLLLPYQQNLASLAADKEALCTCLREMVDHPECFAKPASSTYKNALAFVKANYVQLCEQIQQEQADFTCLNQALTGVQARNDFKELVNNIKVLMETIALKERDALALPVVEHWQAILAELAQYVQQQKQAVDLLTFDDLETSAIALLEHFPEVRHRYHQRFAQIMVDEFQDTNDKQRQLIYLLCGDNKEKLAGLKLFVVGDPKQSIYRFRGADVSVFKRVQQEIVKQQGQDLSMNKNFRSRQAVLQAVNTIFEPLMGTDTKQDVYFSPLEADKPRLEGGAPVELYTARYSKENKATRYEQEAELVAAKILQLQSAGRSLSDITILLRSMTHSRTLMSVLQQYHIPLVLHSGSGFYEQQEVLDILNLLQALANKYHTIALAGVLRSPYFGLDDETLTQLIVQPEAECLWDSLAKAELQQFKPAKQPLVARAGRLLAELRQSASALGLNELLAEIWRLLQVTAVVSQQEQGAVKLANLTKLRSLAMSFVQEQQGTLAKWLDYVAQVRAYGSQETLATVAAQEAVQIMTYHGAKGLEFPVVLLPYLEADEPNDTDSLLFLPPNRLHPERSWGLGVKVLQGYGLEDTYLLKQLRQEDKCYAFAERKRLLYVAFTRAEKQLVLFACGEEGKNYATDTWEQKNWFVQLESIMQKGMASQGLAVRHGDAEDLQSYLQPLASGQQQEAVDVESSLLQPLASYKILGNTYFSPSALQSYAHCQRYYFYHYGLLLPEMEMEQEQIEVKTEKLDAATLGLIVHSTLEYYQAAKYDRDELQHCFKLATQEHLQGRTGDTAPAWKMLEQYLQSALVPPLARAEKETSFTLSVEGLTIAGFIDCMYENADGTWNIIDYKTGRVPEVAQGKNAGYMYQLALYRLAVETLWQRKVKKCELHYLQELKPVGLENEAEYQKYLAEALVHCHAIGEQEKTEAAFPCSKGKQCTYCGYNYMCK